MFTLRYYNTIVLVCCVFLNDTAPTEIYTDLHTLSLHGALPICAVSTAAGTPISASRQPWRTTAKVTNSPVTAGPAQVARKRQKSSAPSRSEEHTSELQSLMRISYAVFCLKKKINYNAT